MATADERIAWFIHNATVFFKKAQYISDIQFTQPLLETMQTTHRLKPTGHIEIQSINLLITKEEDKLCHDIGGEGLECYLFNHHEPNGRFFEMRLKFGPLHHSLGYHFVAPWEKVIAAGVIKADTCVHVYGYREGGLAVFVFVREDLFNAIPAVVGGYWV